MPALRITEPHNFFVYNRLLEDHCAENSRSILGVRRQALRDAAMDGADTSDVRAMMWIQIAVVDSLCRRTPA
ncbi:MAG: hypothetical protein H0V18_15215 [Pyrinomonadaceae bacterium]|nr:hypothetical protein [Pyrinomonadaceae bacterium]